MQVELEAPHRKEKVSVDAFLAVACDSYAFFLGSSSSIPQTYDVSVNFAFFDAD